MPADSTTLNGHNGAEAPAKGNGKARLRTLSDLDGRTRARRDADRTLAALLSDLGGEDRVPAGKRALAEHAAVLNAMATHQGAQFLAGEPVNVGEYATLTNALRRLLETVGLERQARDVTSLGDILRGQRP